MQINTVDFELTDEYQWVKTLTKTHYLVINGIELPSGDVDFGYYNIYFLSENAVRNPVDGTSGPKYKSLKSSMEFI